jgi:hypothetical protein
MKRWRVTSAAFSVYNHGYMARLGAGNDLMFFASHIASVLQDRVCRAEDLRKSTVYDQPIR